MSVMILFIFLIPLIFTCGADLCLSRNIIFIENLQLMIVISYEFIEKFFLFTSYFIVGWFV